MTGRAGIARRVGAIGVVAVAVAATAIFGPSLFHHIGQAFDPRVFNDDARQWIFPLFRYAPNGPEGLDLAGNYQLDLTPVGFVLLYRGLAPLVDPETLSKILPYVLFASALAGVAGAAQAVGGRAAAVASLLLAIQLPVLLERTTGGMPRSFAFPLTALGLWAAAAGRRRALIALVVAASAFYSVSALVLAMVLGSLLLIPVHAYRGTSPWTLRRRVAVLACAGLACAVITVPVIRQSAKWGRQLRPGDVTQYPEAGPRGRNPKIQDRLPAVRLVPVSDVFAEIRRGLEMGITGGGDPLVPSVRRAAETHQDAVVTGFLCLFGAGLAVLAWQDAAAQRALLVPAAGLSGFVLAYLLSPRLYLPERYAMHALVIFAAAVLPAAVGALAAVCCPVGWRPTARSLGAVIAGAAAIFLLGGRGDGNVGYIVRVPQDVHLYEVIHALPRNVLVAGWPGGAVDSVPYLSRRRAFLTEENHHAFHEDYVLEMRRRMMVVTRAFYATDTAAVMELREHYGVTHLLVDERELARPAAYFEPFTDEIARLWSEADERPFGLSTVIDRTAVFREGSVVLLDLSKL